MPIFTKWVEAIRQGFLIKRESAKDKEFRFQNWFIERLNETKSNFDQGGRNSYPDFTMVKYAEGFELKGLAYPGRDASFNSNSQVPKEVAKAELTKRATCHTFPALLKRPPGVRSPFDGL